VLAVVLREKVGAKIKEQAKQRAPEVVRKAGEAIQPKFEAIVDQFAEKLADFVESAGEALHRGISEVLDQTLAERQNRAQDAAAAAVEIDTHGSRLKAIEVRLTALRAELWQSSTPPAS
jgi:hypothetical protein